MDMEGWDSSPGPIPAVDPSDLRKVWDFMSGIPDTGSGATGVDVDVFKSICSPGADVIAVWWRASLLQLGERLGLVSRWLSNGRLDDAVINVAADFPMDKIEAGVLYNGLPFDVQKFI